MGRCTQRIQWLVTENQLRLRTLSNDATVNFPLHFEHCVCSGYSQKLCSADMKLMQCALAASVFQAVYSFHELPQDVLAAMH